MTSPTLTRTTGAARPARAARPAPAAPPAVPGARPPRGRSRARGVVALAGAAVVTLVAVVGVGAFGQGVDATARMSTTQNAANAVVGDVRVVDAYVVRGTGDPVVRVAFATTGGAADRLVSVAAGRSGTASRPRGLAEPPATPARLGTVPALTPGTLVDLVNGPARITLTGVTATPGSVVPVTFRFARAGDVTLALPVVAAGTAGQTMP